MSRAKYLKLVLIISLLHTIVSDSVDCKDAPMILNPSTGLHEQLSVPFESFDVDGIPMSSSPIEGGAAIDLTYIQSIFTFDEATALVNLCDARNGWTASPQRNEQEELFENTARTSTSCPLYPAMLYVPHLPRLRKMGKLTVEMESEVLLTWNLSWRLASILRTPLETLEPLQLLRYQGAAGQHYRKHHDHGAWYGATTEQRPVTLLIWLSSVPPTDGGGHTVFPSLNISVLPRTGDGLYWRNSDDSGKPIRDAIHEATAPVLSSTIKYAMNVWVNEQNTQRSFDKAYVTK